MILYIARHLIRHVIWKVKQKFLFTFIRQIHIPAIALIIEIFTEKQYKVLVTPPAYPPFFLLAENQDRDVIYSALVEQDGQYTIDFKDFEEKLRSASLFILCNPHNSGGRTWTAGELQEITRLFSKYDVLTISDEIHGDLIIGSNYHTSL